MQTKPTPQVPALNGMTPLGLPPRKEHPDEIADRAAKASEAGDHTEAERLYLTAAARAAAYTNQPTMKKNVVLWDRCAARERRLAELTKDDEIDTDAENTVTAEELLTTKEVGKRLRCGEVTVRRMIRDGELVAARTGKRLLIPVAAVERLLARAK